MDLWLKFEDKRMKNWVFSAAILFSFFITAGCSEPAATGEKEASGEPAAFIMGVDLSYLNQILDHNGIYKMDGEIMDPYKIFADKGSDYSRVRVFHDPEWSKEVYGAEGTQYYHDLKDAALTIERSKTAGMKILLDLHYSDRWADPAHQEAPQAWMGLSSEVVQDSVYAYTLASLNYLAERNLLPEMIQIGNETNCGMIFPYGNVCESAGWKELAELLNSGIRAVREVEAAHDKEIQVMLHVAQPENVSPWFNKLLIPGLVNDFDIIGLSYYPKWSEVSLSELSTYISQFKENFKKDVIVVETAYPFTLEGNDDYPNILGEDALVEGYPATEEGQRNFMIELVKEIKKGGGIGVFYWEPGWITSDMKDLWGQGSSWENNALFDYEGNAHLGFDYMSFKYEESK